MMHFFTCEITIGFSDKEVVEWLIDNEELDEDDAENYTPTHDELQRYAWECVENEYCKYGEMEER